MKHEAALNQKAYWEERLREHWGLDGVGSLAYGRHYNAWLYRVRRRAFREIVARLRIDLARARVLDVGCGTGFYLGLWRELGARRVAGLDFSPTAIARLRDDFPGVDLREADIADSPPPFGTADFDVISAFDVLFHIVDDQRYGAALRNIASLLPPGGLFLSSEPFPREAASQYLDYWKARTLGEVESELNRVGFDVVARVPVFVLMNAPVDVRSELYPRIWELAMKPVRRSEAVGYALGMLLYPFELLLRKLVREGPSSELMVCRKR